MDRADPASMGHLIRLLPACLRDDEDDLRQSALGLVGDLAKHAPLALADRSALAALHPGESPPLRCDIRPSERRWRGEEEWYLSAC
jgi:hypothetical protein